MTIALIVFACSFAGAAGGSYLRTRLPSHHVRRDSQELMKMGAGVIATLTALVLGLLISSAKNSYDTVNEGLTQCGADVILLDRLLGLYGPETKDERLLLRRTVGGMIVRAWPEDMKAFPTLEPVSVGVGLTALHDGMLKLSPQNDAQRSLQSQAVQSIVELRQRRLQVSERGEIPLPTPFLVVMIFWLTVLFASFGLLAHPNPTTLSVLLLCALSVAGAIFLLVEMSHPTTGLMKVSSAPLVKALGILSR
ncbi:MAG: hypothetical protein NTV86_10725 [Planctomycetota bacterium]|nr:hypothetical protein [Planctomycetota bacterium]